MAYEKAQLIVQYIDTFGERAKQVTDTAAELKKFKEFAQWQAELARAIDNSGNADAKAAADQDLTRQYEQLSGFAPMPPNYGVTTTLTSTAVVTGNASLFNALVSMPLVAMANEIPPLIEKYNNLQQSQGRLQDAKARLGKLFPHLVLFFVGVERAYHTSSMREEDWTHAATDMRNLIEKLKGELLDKARRTDKETPNWKTMVDRLTVEGSFQRNTLLAEERNRAELYDLLSRITKYRNPVTRNPLVEVWPRVVDHVYIVCGCLLS